MSQMLSEQQNQTLQQLSADNFETECDLIDMLTHACSLDERVDAAFEKIAMPFLPWMEFIEEDHPYVVRMLRLYHVRDPRLLQGQGGLKRKAVVALFDDETRLQAHDLHKYDDNDEIKPDVHYWYAAQDSIFGC
jgi:hypothetical protein